MNKISSVATLQFSSSFKKLDPLPDRPLTLLPSFQPSPISSPLIFREADRADFNSVKLVNLRPSCSGQTLMGQHGHAWMNTRTFLLASARFLKMEWPGRISDTWKMSRTFSQRFHMCMNMVFLSILFHMGYNGPVGTHGDTWKESRRKFELASPFIENNMVFLQVY